MSVFYEIGDHSSVNDQYPGIADDGKGNDIVIWQEARRDRSEGIMMMSFHGGRPVSDPVQVSGEGLGLRPSVRRVGSDVWIAWSEFSGGRWSIVLRSYRDGVLSDPVVVEEGDALFYVSLSEIDGGAAVLYNRQAPGSSEVRLALAKNGFRPETVSVSAKCYRPSAADGGDGSFIVVYDCFNGRTYDLLARTCVAGCWSGEERIDVSDNRSTHPLVVSPEKGRFVITWYENGSSSYFRYEAVDAALKNGELDLSNRTVMVENRGWYNNVASFAAKGYVIFCYTVGRNMFASLRHPDGHWGTPALLSYNDGCGGIRPKAVILDDGSVHYVWQWTNKNGHMDRHAVVVYSTTSIDEMEAADDSETVNTPDRFCLPIPGEKDLGAIPENEKKAWLERHGIKGMLLFGDIHGQSNLSDGMGEIDQYYHYAMVDSKMDFCALTDHDCYPDNATDAEWEWNRATRNIFNAEKDFSALLAYEWTSNEYNHDFGHKNVYYPSSEGGLYQCTCEEGLNPDRLYAAIKRDGGLCIPHHPAADWGHVSAATDWDYCDESVQRAAEIFSRHADYEKTENMSRYTKNVKKFPGKCIQDALRRRYRPGFVAGSDSHQMEHGKEGGILGAFVSENTSEEVWSAIWNKRTYGTTGARILLSFRLGDAFMGEEVRTTGTRNFTAAVFAVSAVRKIEIIRNGEVAYSMKPEGRDVDISFTDPGSSDSAWYYLRVEQEDDQIAWSSPIYVN